MIILHDCEMNLIRLFHKHNCESLLFSVGFRALMSPLFKVIYLFPCTVESLKTIQFQFLVGDSYACGNVQLSSTQQLIVSNEKYFVVC